jgi:hypothetical protein
LKSLTKKTFCSIAITRRLKSHSVTLLLPGAMRTVSSSPSRVDQHEAPRRKTARSRVTHHSRLALCGEAIQCGNTGKARSRPALPRRGLGPVDRRYAQAHGARR